MRFSAVQEDSYGVGLGQETPLNDVDECMMAATGEVAEPGGGGAAEEGSMISNLPLLFAGGYPTSLEKVTLPELERFVTFMVQCSLGHDTAEVISEPQWWPKEIKFSIPLVRPKKINESYMGNLKKLVFRCYTYHRSEYLLRFCSYLAQYPRDKLEYVNNYDSTTSLYLKTTGKLLVTFRNENMNYDRKIEGPRKSLIQWSKSSKTSYPNGTKILRRRAAQKQAPSPAMVEPPIEDIYLCDNCDAELVGMHKMKEHEKLCYRVEPRPITPEYEEVPEIKQDQFMEYFKLSSSSSPISVKTKESISNALPYDNIITQSRTSSRIRGSINLTRCPTIPFSSPAGLALGKKSKMMTDSLQQERLERIERHLNAPPLSSATKPKWFTKTYEFDRWACTYKPKFEKADDYIHNYNFWNYTTKPALDLRSQLLYIACKPLYVAVERLTDEQVEKLRRDPSRYKSPERKVPRIRTRAISIEPSPVAIESAPGDITNPIVIDLDDEDDEVVVHTPQILPRFSIDRPITFVQRTPPVATVYPAIHRRPGPKSMQMKSHLMRPTPGKTTPIRLDQVKQSTIAVVNTNNKRPRQSTGAENSVIVVDLCSSDDEELKDSSPLTTSTDENCDPMQSFLRNSLLTPSKLCTKPCIQPADSTSNWFLADKTMRRDAFIKHPQVFKP